MAILGQRGRRGALLLVAVLAACSRGPREPGLHFETTLHDAGRMFAGPTVPLEYRFWNGPETVRITELDPNCGCLEPVLWVEGEAVRLPADVPPGGRGSVRVSFATAGFRGRKLSGVTVRGEGPGLPIELKVDSILDTWLVPDPEIVDFGEVDGESETQRRVRVSGLEPWRLQQVVVGTPGLSVRGVPSAAPARQQEFDLVLEPGQEEGPHAAFLNLVADNRESVRLPVKWTLSGRLYVIPHKTVMFGRLRPGVAGSAAVEVGVRDGELDPPEVRVEGLEEVHVEVRTLQALGRYRIDLTLPDDLPAGAFAGTVHLLLRHRHEGRVEEVSRELRLIGVVQD